MHWAFYSRSYFWHETITTTEKISIMKTFKLKCSNSLELLIDLFYCRSPGFFSLTYFSSCLFWFWLGFFVGFFFCLVEFWLGCLCWFFFSFLEVVVVRFSFFKEKEVCILAVGFSHYKCISCSTGITGLPLSWTGISL